MDRRTFLKSVTAGMAGAAISKAFADGNPAGSKAVDKPNIIFILTDDLGYGDLGCYGQKVIQTPNIDRMAAEGIRFTECYTGSPVCAPSRCVLMTGKHTGHATVRDNFAKVGGVLILDNGPPQRRVPLRPEDITVAEILKRAGYVTGITGKWGLGEPGTEGVPNKKGFDEWFGYLNQRRAHTYYPPFLWHNEEKVILDGKRYSHDLFTEFALNFIRRHKDEPFFLYLAYTIPHGRYEIPSTDPYTEKPWPEEAKAYAAMVTRLDRDVGRILDLLKELGVDGRTLVFFCSDNGAARRWEGLFDSSGPLRGLKGDVYEGGIRTPMIVRWPGKVPAGVISDAAWYFADFLPTVAELIGVNPPPGVDGISVLPTLLGKEQNLDDRFMYWEFPGRGFQQAVRIGDWKAVRPKWGEPLELYNLAVDPGEKDDVSAQHPDVMEMIEEYLKTARTDSEYWPLPRS